MLRISIFLLIAFSLTGYATIFKGYESHVELYLVPDSLRIFTQYGEEIPIREMEYTSNNIVRNINVIYLRSNQTHVLKFQKGEKQKIISIYPKLSGGWFMLDLIAGGLPVFIDMYTGAWYHFDDVNAFID